MSTIPETITSTVNSAISTVTNAIYGSTSNETGGVEPVSGETGKGTATDPYDKGNDATMNPSTESENTTAASSKTDTPTSAPSATSGGAPSTSDHTTASHSTSDAPTSVPQVTGPGPSSSSRPDAGSRPGDVRPTEANENRPNQNAGGFGTAEPSVSADPASGQKPEQKQQGGDRPLDEPTGEQKEAIKETKKEGDDQQRHPSSEQERQEMAEKGELPKDPNDHSGEPMKMHDGSSGEDKKTDKEGEGGETDRKKSVGQEGGQPHGSAKGTGEEWVKTSGFPADGGDFDATKPGAGKEATRLLEEKGVHHEPGTVGSGPAKTEGHAESHDGKEKTSKMAKLKEKLHLGTGKNLDN